MSVTPEEVQHIALLSRLEVTEDEAARYAEQLSQILEYAAQLNQLDTSAVEPTFHAVPLANVFREDHPGTPLSLDQALQNAPRSRRPFFEVPKVADGS
jgi:aspartyl-tRNA(Asn)/glutamyl-tRNA(Gln) amidotransferase subunit C